MSKFKKLTTVLLALAMMAIFSQSAFAADPYYTNPNGSTRTASLLTVGTTASDFISFAMEEDYYKVNVEKGKLVKITLNSPWGNCAKYFCNDYLPRTNYDFAVFELVNGVIKYVTPFGSYVEGGKGGTDSLMFYSSGNQYYIKVSGHPEAPIGKDPYGNPIYNYHYSAIMPYHLNASYLNFNF
ncbi:hypothetical protein [Cohnella panacarvi]|uniref:hypothetical protein n=1 Tax=Cohnella panacarvi TaxID=400776 RepID=UPI00047D3D9E|nr:hypothetical protein [Cohnella panacarvi]